MFVRSFRPVWLAALVVGAFSSACAAGSEGTEDLPPGNLDSGWDDTSVSPDTSIDDTGSGDTSADTAADTAETGPLPCKTNADCVGDPAGPFCLVGGDGGKSYCVPCLPAPFDECGAGTFCNDSTYTCEAGCKNDGDCKPSSGDAGTDGGSEAGADGGSGASMVCDAVKHRCVGCVADPDCPAGFLCDRPSGACVPGCNTSKPCPTGKDCCSGSCVDTQKDLKNCGTCGNSCPTPTNATAACTAGSCGIGTCTTGFGDCNGSATDGCETDLKSNKDNCGACGTVCALANATAACSAGACAIATCNGGFDDCDKIASTGCETDLKTESNCGGCGKLCTIPNGTGSCSTGTCLVAGCATGFGDCDGLTSNGCESNIVGGTPGPGGSILNCGACGTSCSVANGSPSCSMGTCKVGGCTAPYADCNGSYADGCETNTLVNVNNCGGCGNACSTVGGTPSCAAGTCSIACSPGRGDCDGKASNGCEIDLRTDKNNCNACGTVCSTSATVLATMCAPSGPSGGACNVTTCAAGTYDRNKIFSDGCECTEDSVGDNCGAAKDLGSIALDVSPKMLVTGNLVGPGDSDEDWYKITFVVGPSCSYTPSVSLAGSDVKMQVFTSCSGSSASGSYACAAGEPGSSNSPLDSWEFRQAGACGRYAAIDPTPDNTKPFIRDNAASVVYVRVYRSGPSTSCYPYQLTIGN